MRRLLPLPALAAWMAVVAGGALLAVRGDLYLPAAVHDSRVRHGRWAACDAPSRNPIGWLMLATSSAPLFDFLIGLPIEVQNGIIVGGLALVLVLSPTGSPLRQWWYAPMVLVVVSWSALGWIGSVTLANDLEIPVGVVLAGGSLLVCAAAPVVRYRGAVGVERSQLRWLGAVATFTGVALVAMAIGFATGVEWNHGSIVAGLASVAGGALQPTTLQVWLRGAHTG